MSQEAKYRPGTIVSCESGSYSDFGIVGIVVTLQDCDLHELAELFRDAWRGAHPKAESWKKPGPNEFVAWLVAEQHVAPVNYTSIHLGDYGDLSIS